MAGLQRFITYINQYENDEKMNSSGFAKVEIRGNVCRLEVHIRNVSTEQTELTVYLFARNAEIMQGIPVGSMEISRGSGDVRYVFDTKEMQNFELSMSDMQGLFIPLDENVYLASQWKEGTIAGKNFRILKKREMLKEEAEKEDQTVETMSSFKQKNENDSKIRPQQKSTAEIARREKKRAEDAPGDLQDKEVTEENGFTIQKDVPSSQEGSAQQGNQPPQQQENTQQQDDSQAHLQENVNIRATELPLEDFLEETGWDRIFRKLRLKSEICFPFEGQEIECIRMNLNDLREFPQKYWYLGKNSFLLHGFFNYRHILFGVLEENGKKEYFLGIPGVFQNQERLMASMFGFPGFRTAKAAAYKTGNFGYWYRII